MFAFSLSLPPPPPSLFAQDTIFWLAALGGVAQGFAALALYKAYETAPSTLIVPLTQLTAVMTLVVSFVVRPTSYFDCFLRTRCSQ